MLLSLNLGGSSTASVGIDLLGDLILRKKVTNRAASSVICVAINALLDGPNNDNWRKYTQERTPKPTPTARHSLSAS
jgi:hypothetical protein